jgi:hypothetical protein
VTGIRQDAYADAHRIPVEEAKPDKERGLYLHPELFGAPVEKSIAAARTPQSDESGEGGQNPHLARVNSVLFSRGGRGRRRTVETATLHWESQAFS